MVEGPKGQQQSRENEECVWACGSPGKRMFQEERSIGQYIKNVR